jgi:hypothetical protein
LVLAVIPSFFAGDFFLEDCLVGVPSFFAGDLFSPLVEFRPAFPGNFCSVLLFDLAIVL